MKPILSLLLLATFTVQLAQANDIEKVMNKALGSGKGQLFKQAGNFAKSNLLNKGPSAAATTVAPDDLARAQAATNVSGTAAAHAATSLEHPAPSTTVPNVSATSPALPPSIPTHGNSALKDKLMHRAAVESEKYAHKYGDKYLKQGKGQLGKLLN